MAIFGIRKIGENGENVDIATIQIKNNRKMQSNADKAMVDILSDKGLPASEYETHLLWIEG